MSGFTENPPGVGGPSVAQTWRDQFGASGSFIGSSGTEQYLFSGYPLSGLWWQSGAVCTTLGETLLSGSLTVNLSSVSFFPTGHRWYGKVIPLLNATGPQSGQQVTSGESEEVILFEGTSGGRAGVYSGNYVGIVQRGVQGTKQQHHANQSVVIQTVPDAGYAVNLVTHEKGQFVYPGAVTSGGIQEVQVVPQTQSVRILDTAGVVVSGIRHYSGVVNNYDPTTPVSGGPWVKTDYVWAVTRSTSDVLQSSGLYDGQFLGHSFAQSGMDSAPVYAVSAPSSDPLRVLSRMGGGSSQALLKQPLYASQTWVVVDDVTNLPADQAWWAYVYTPGWSASGEILLMAPTSGGITGVDIGIRLSGYQYFSGGYWSGVINPSNPDYPTDMAEFGYFLKIVGRGMFNTQVLSGVVSGTSFDKSTTSTQGWSSGAGRLSFTHATSVPEGFSDSTMIHEAQMSFPGLNWVSGGTREQIIAPANRVIRIVSEQVLYISGYAALRPAQAYFLDFAGDSTNAGYYTTSQSVWAQFLEEAYPPDIFGNNPLARRGYVGTQMASGLRLPAPDLTRPYFGNLVGYSTPFSGVLSPSANYRSRPVYVIQGQLPETATIRIASKTGDHTYQGQILAPDLPYGFGLSSGEPVVCSGVGAIGISVDLLAINGENNLPVGTNYNARYTGYDALYYLDRQSITITTNGLTWPNVTTIELDGTSGGAGMFATPTNTNLSGSPTAVRLFKA
jgi:hypothetical protein